MMFLLNRMTRLLSQIRLIQSEWPSAMDRLESRLNFIWRDEVKND